MDRMISSIIELSLTSPKSIEMHFELAKLNKFHKDFENSNTGKFYIGCEISNSIRCMINTRAHSKRPTGPIPSRISASTVRIIICLCELTSGKKLCD